MWGCDEHIIVTFLCTFYHLVCVNMMVLGYVLSYMQVIGVKCKMEKNNRIKPTKEVKSAQKELQLDKEIEEYINSRRKLMQ